jgi:hypothetical protein
MYRVLIRELSRYSMYPLYRRVGSSISGLIPPFLDNTIDNNINWTDEGSNEWEPIPNLFKLIHPHGSTWYPFEDITDPKPLTTEKQELDENVEILNPEDFDETSTGPPTYTATNVPPIQHTYHPRVISEHRFESRLAMEFDEDVAEKLFGVNIKNSGEGQADSLDGTVFEVWK